MILVFGIQEYKLPIMLSIVDVEPIILVSYVLLFSSLSNSESSKSS